MDPRVSTAPTPKGKRWVAKNIGASCLLRQPSGSSVNAAVSAVVDRPQTCPIPTLTPQFHWNLNNSALKTLTRSQIEHLYGLFKFYDSSAVGDSLPSINCSRLVEILRDARLLSESTADSCCTGQGLTNKRLSVESVERIFAQAVMGKLRVYLDADGEPALPFPLFCGALMNCAMLLIPSAHPEPALRQMLPILLEGSTVNGNPLSTSKGLLSHLPAVGTTSLWSSIQSYGPQQETGDFLALSPFQQVIADCTRDKLLEELKQEQLARSYQLPPRLLASFHRDTIALISSQFRLFDVFDRGTLPRHEIFPLLSSLGKHTDLPDPCAVVSRLSASGPPQSLSSSESGAGGEITLTQLLQAIESTREAKRHSIAARLAAMKVNSTREEPTPLTPTQKPDSKPTFEEGVTDDGNSIGAGNSDKAAQSQHDSATENSPTSRQRAKRTVTTRSRSRKSITSQDSSSTGANTSSHPLLTLKHHSSSRSSLAHSKKKPRKSSFRANLQHEATATCAESNDSASSDTGSADSDEENADRLPSPSSDANSDSHARGASIRHGHETISEAPTTSKTLEVFLLLGGDHDGAICCSISLAFQTREIVESEGLYFSTAPSEMTRTRPVLPTQATLTNALLMLKKRVLAKAERGFAMRPTNQLDAVNKLLQGLQKKQPRFSIARGSASSHNLTAVALSGSTSPLSLTSTSKLQVSSATGHARVSAGPPVRKLPRSKPPHLHHIELPTNYRDLLSTWGVSEGGNGAWIHDLNAASPLKSASPMRQLKSVRPAVLSPLRISSRQEA